MVVEAHAVLADPALGATVGIHANPCGHARLAETAIPLVDQATLQLR